LTDRCYITLAQVRHCPFVRHTPGF
jgi:hypothetical protein